MWREPRLDARYRINEIGLIDVPHRCATIKRGARDEVGIGQARQRVKGLVHLRLRLGEIAAERDIGAMQN